MEKRSTTIISDRNVLYSLFPLNTGKPGVEKMMSLLLEPEVAGWSLAQVDKTRKAVAKKKPKEFKELTEQFFENAKEKNLSKNLTDYVWNVLVKTQKGYSFYRKIGAIIS